ADRVRKWVRHRGQVAGLLGEAHDISLCPVHGDLNRYNILLWVECGHFFLIDFDTYQEKGHPLQDFAHFETEIKFGLMDSEDELTYPFDLSAEPLPSWRKAEDSLLDASPGRPLLIDSIDKPIRRALQLVGSIRDQALEVHRLHRGDEGGGPSFRLE